MQACGVAAAGCTGAWCQAAMYGVGGVVQRIDAAQQAQVELCEFVSLDSGVVAARSGTWR